MEITIIGTGNMARGIATRAIEGGRRYARALAVADRTRRGFINLECALEDAEDAAAAARSLAARSLGARADVGKSMHR